MVSASCNPGTNTQSAPASRNAVSRETPRHNASPAFQAAANIHRSAHSKPFRHGLPDRFHSFHLQAESKSGRCGITGRVLQIHPDRAGLGNVACSSGRIFRTIAISSLDVRRYRNLDRRRNAPHHSKHFLTRNSLPVGISQLKAMPALVVAIAAKASLFETPVALATSQAFGSTRIRPP